MRERRLTDASILYEMPHQKGSEGCEEHHYEEWQTGNPGNLPGMRDQGI